MCVFVFVCVCALSIVCTCVYVIGSTVFNRIETVATINFSTVQVWKLIKGGSYSRAATINCSAVQVRLVIVGCSHSWAALIRGRLLLISALFKCVY